MGEQQYWPLGLVDLDPASKGAQKFTPFPQLISFPAKTCMRASNWRIYRVPITNMTNVTGAKVSESDHAPVHVELAPRRREAVARSGDRPRSRQRSGEIHPGHGHRVVDVQVGEEACARRGIGTGPTLPSPSSSSSLAARPPVRLSMLDESGRAAPLPFLSPSLHPLALPRPSIGANTMPVATPYRQKSLACLSTTAV